MQRIAAPDVSTRPGHRCGPYIPPGALIDQLVDIHVGNSLVTVKGAVGREALALGTYFAREANVPAVFWSTDVDSVPKFPVALFVTNVQIVEIKSANIGLNLNDAVKAPMLFMVTDAMPMNTGVSSVIPMRLKLRLV